MKAPTMSERSYSAAYQDPDAVSRYAEEIYRPGGFDDVLWRVEQRQLTRLLRRIAPDLARASVMDFACGQGRILAYLDGRVGSLTGVDISPLMLERARAAAGEAELICADIVDSPQDVPGDMDLITCFRFLLLAEPALRESCVRALTTKLRQGGAIVFGLHGNPMSRRGLVEGFNQLLRPKRSRLPAFSLRDMRDLASRCGLRVTMATGLGYLPRSVARLLPTSVFERLETFLAGAPVLWRFGTNLIVVCKPA